MKQINLLILYLFSIGLVGCASDLLRAPDLDDNKLYSRCSQGLVEVYALVVAQKQNMPSRLKQRLVSLLVAAEIDSQFKHYPYCVDKLERARLFLKQANLDRIEHNS